MALYTSIRMLIGLLTCNVALAMSTSLHVPGLHVLPGGHDCVVSLRNGGFHNASALAANSARAQGREHCGLQPRAPEIQIYAADVHYESKVPLTSFTADWIVPPLPKYGHENQVVYFWPGFKSSQPEMGYPVLQPVLQYGEQGGKWQLQSWFVDANDRHYPVVTAPSISVSPGDQITSYMSLSSDNSTWTVSGTDKTTGEDSTLKIAFEKAGDVDYDWAMLVNENINVNQKCFLMPASSNVTFTRVSVNGNDATPWTTRANCNGNPQCDCKNSATVAANGDVTLAWNRF